MKYDIESISKRMKKRKKINGVLHIVFYFILIQIMLFSLFLILVELGDSHELPSFLNIDVYTISSDSMSPKLKTDDIIVVKKGYKNEEFKPGNIITFKRKDGELITHRISKVILSDMQKAYKTKGDNNEAEDDSVVQYKDIVGKVIYVMPKLGTAVKILKNKAFFSFGVALLIVVVIYDIRIKKRKMDRKKVRERYEKKSEFYRF